MEMNCLPATNPTLAGDGFKILSLSPLTGGSIMSIGQALRGEVEQCRRKELFRFPFNEPAGRIHSDPVERVGDPASEYIH